MRVIKRILLPVCLLLGLAASLTGCHTMNGVGQDVQSGGHAISRAAT